MPAEIHLPRDLASSEFFRVSVNFPEEKRKELPLTPDHVEEAR